MTRTFALLSLVTLLAGCTRYHSRAQGPFAKPVLEPPVAAKPVTNQSPLGMSSAKPPGATDPGERSVVPPKSDAPAGAALPDADPEAFPPFRKREPKAPLPSPFAPKTDAPKSDTPAKGGLTELKALVATANAAWKGVDTIEAQLTRREINPQGAATSEVVQFQYRREPMSVHTHTISESGKDREVLYSPAKHGDKIYLKIGKGDERAFLKVGSVLDVSPDNAMVKEKARYSIRDASIGKSATRLADTVAKIEAGKLPADALLYLGPVKRDEYAYPLTGVTLAMKPGDDPLFPNGGTRHFYFDLKEKSPSFGLPVLTFATDDKGKEAEYYLFEKVKSPADLTDAHFDPKRLKK